MARSPDLDGVRAAPAARLRQVLDTVGERLAWDGFLAGALLAMLVRELGLWALIMWDHRSMLITLVIAVVGAIGSRWRRFARLLIAADVALLCLLCVVALTPMMSKLMGNWVRGDPRPDAGVDAIVVLSADVTSGGALSAIATDRLVTALDLVRGGAAPRLVTTRVVSNQYGGYLNSDADQVRLVTLAGLADRWIPVRDSIENTRDEAIAVARRMRLLGIRRIGLVTSPSHTRRACATFEAVGLQVICVPALERGEQTAHPVSERDRLAAFRSYLYERLAWIEYSWKGWLTPSPGVAG